MAVRRWMVAFAVAAIACGSAAHKGTGAPQAAAAGVASMDALANGAMLFADLGTHHRAVTTRSPEAQRFFDQGLRLVYGFNHDEAARSFARAARIDPGCAMCFWGAALVLGPNYNVPMLPDRAAAAWEGLTKAQALAPWSSPVEKALIGALAKRYPGPEPKDPAAMQPYNQAYANAMRDVARAYPDDLDVQVLFAEAMMDANPWKLWTLDGKPAPGTEEIVATLEQVLARDPQHPGANHYYIHAVEASGQPDRAVAAADRLPGLMPGAGHIVHMPAHIYQRVGRYADAAEANRRAVKADEVYMDKAKPFGYYPMYLAHNHGFLAFATSMQGRAAESLSAARESAKNIPPAMMDMMPGMDFFATEPLLVMVRFGKFDELLAEPRPDPKYQVLTGLWLHAHGLALLAKGKIAEAKADLAELIALATAVGPDVVAGNNSARAVLAVAAKILEAASAGKDKSALALWAKAVELADGLAYSEPADWFYPVRHYYGQALLDSKQAKQAEAVYREDLRRNPGNGWALYGLMRALRAQKRDAEAADVDKQFRQAWTDADVQLTATRY